MAITSADCAIWRELRLRNLIPDRPKVLEIGKANWYGDVAPVELERDMAKFCENPRDLRKPDRVDAWTVADLYYRVMLRRPTRLSVDLDRDAADVRHDFNRPGLPCEVEKVRPGFLPADIVINTGTTEHIFDQRMVWESIHDTCKVGGLMV